MLLPSQPKAGFSGGGDRFICQCSASTQQGASCPPTLSEDSQVNAYVNKEGEGVMEGWAGPPETHSEGSEDKGSERQAQAPPAHTDRRVARRLEAWQSVKGKGRLPQGGDEKPEGKKLLEEPAGQLEGCMRQIKSGRLRSPPGRTRRAVWLEPQGEGGRVQMGPGKGEAGSKVRG